MAIKAGKLSEISSRMPPKEESFEMPMEDEMEEGAEEESAEKSPEEMLKSFSDDDLIEELKRRGIEVEDAEEPEAMAPEAGPAVPASALPF